MNPVFLDFETQSAADLRKVGGRCYAEDPSTRVLTAVILVDGVYHCWVPDYITDEYVHTADLWLEEWGPRPEIRIHTTAHYPDVLRFRDRLHVAHNAFSFDKHIASEVCDFHPPWLDTLCLARIAGLPGGLDRISQALDFGRKDQGGKLLLKLSKATFDTDFGRVVYPKTPIGSLTAVLRYNVQDVRLLEMLWRHFDDLEVELDVIEAHVRINDRGVRVDTDLMEQVIEISEQSVELAASEIEQLTGGALSLENLRSVKQVTEWLASKGVHIRDWRGKSTLRKDVVEQALANPWTMVDGTNPIEAAKAIDPKVFDVLRLRGQALRITGAKLERAGTRVGRDGRIRDLFQYHAAHTGRWSSTGVQVHNLPRPKKGVDLVGLLDSYYCGEWTEHTRHTLCKCKVKSGIVDDALAALIRPCFIPADGHCFAIADYAAIECRGLAWIAGQEDLLETLASGGDVYKQMASKIFGVPVDEVTKDQRQVGKVTILGCGYSMSAVKFALYVGLMGIDLEASGTSADACVDAFRDAYPMIAGHKAGMINGRIFRRGGIWDRLIKSAVAAVEGGNHYACKCSFEHVRGNLIVTLPSGRKLTYHNARIEERIPGYVYTLGLEPLPKSTLVYDSPTGERSLYGGAMCFTADTQVVTDRGVCRIVDVRPGDRVWDGVEWVTTDGVKFQGIKEVGTCLGVSVTGDHLITDGTSWKSAIASDVPFLRRALEWARNSVNSPSFRRHRAPKTASQSVSARAERLRRSTIGDYFGMKRSVAGRAEIVVAGPTWRQRRQRYSPTSRSVDCGNTDTRELSHVARILNATHTQTTAVAGYGSVKSGSTIGSRSTGSRSRCRGGMIPNSISIGSTTTGIMSLGMCDWSVDRPIPSTGGTHSWLNTAASPTRSSISRQRFAHSGTETPFVTTSTTGVHPSGLWTPTGERSPVFDLINCGPRNRFTVITNNGPLTVHNCENVVQAICRDLLACAIVECERSDLPIVLHVHDEIVAEVLEETGRESLERLAEIMRNPPAWADGFPVNVEGYLSPCYLKEPIEGWAKT